MITTQRAALVVVVRLNHRAVQIAFHHLEAVDEARVSHLLNVVLEKDFAHLEKRFARQQAVTAGLVLGALALEVQLFGNLMSE